MRIATCDDDRQQLDKLLALLNGYIGPMGVRPIVKGFVSGTELLDAMDHEEFDLALLDILMPGLTGMEVAHEIRAKNERIRIVFLTSSPEFAVESYKVHAFDYLMKPVSGAALYGMLDRLTGQIDAVVEALRINTPKSIFTIPYAQIEYVEINNRTLVFHMTDNSERLVPGRLADYEDQLLERPEFIKIHRSYIVNLDRIRTLEGKSAVTLTGVELPIARGLAKSVRDTYMDHLFKN